MASQHRSTLRVVGEDEKRDTRRELPSDLFARATHGATNDEALELAYRLFENLGYRAENVSKIARASHDRDAINEAWVFVSLVDKVVPHAFWSIDRRASAVWDRVRDAKKRVEQAQRSQAKVRPEAATQLEVNANEEADDEKAADAIPEFTDKRVKAAVRTAIRAQRLPHCRGAVHSSDVLAVLAPGAASHRNSRPTRAAMRVSQRLSKLAKAGSIVRLRPKWGNGSNFWTLEGEQLGDYITKGWVRDAS